MKLLQFLFTGLILAYSSVSYALDANNKAFKSPASTDLIHIAPSFLPDPGANLELVLNLKNSKATDLPARLLLNSDGRLMELNLVEARFNNQEIPEYRFQVSAPLAELQYQFVIQVKDGPPIKTQYFNTRRKCIPSVDIDNSLKTSSGNNLTSQNEEKLASLVGQARSLEFQIDSFERASRLLDEVKNLLGSKQE